MKTREKLVTFIVIAGGSASGKSTVAKKIAAIITKTTKNCDNNVIFLQMDNYYKDLSNLTHEQRKKNNYDHPCAFDKKLLITNINLLLARKPIKEPIYDFKTNNRSDKVKTIAPGDVIILDGILALENETIRNLATIKIFVDTSSDIRLLRRITRDVETRSRNLTSVLNQYATTVKPMHEAFVEPTKRFADIIIPYDSHNIVAIDLIATKIKTLLKSS